MRELNNILSQSVVRFGVAQAVLDRSFEVAFLVADIEALALVHVGKYTLRLVQSIDGVGQLNLAAATWLLLFKNVKNLGCQQISTDNGEVTWRLIYGWLFDELLNVVKILIQHVARINHAILGYSLVWHLHHGNRRGVRLVVLIDQLLGQRYLVAHQVVAEHNDKRFFTNEAACTVDGVT